MRFDTSQQMKLGQQMKLAPRMIQSMEILQMPLTELQERIDQELESNIALELVDPSNTDDDYDRDRKDALREETMGERELVVGEDSPTGAEDFERLGTMESNYSEAFDNEYSSGRYSRSRMAGERDDKMDAMANVAARAESLSDQLLHQWHLCDVDPAILEAGTHLISYINDDGMLDTDFEQILDQTRNVPGQEFTMDLLSAALGEIQVRLDPPGVGARDRRECLVLQIDRYEDEPDLVESASHEEWEDVRLLILNHYDDLLQNRLPKIAQATGFDMERIQHAMQLMKKLTLSPGKDVVDEEVPPIIPDVIIEYDEDAQELTARLSNELLPSLRLSGKYVEMSKDREVEKKTREFVGDNIRRASWLLDAIQQRQHTLMRVVKVVLVHQREFFELGPQHLKPLPMIDVADQLGIHVATVSRAVSDKWLQTPRGLIALRKFFSGGTETDSGKDMSWEAVKAILKEVIDEEDKKKPLSDEAVAKVLKERGIEIARRTVVKYRQQLGIPPARRRRQF